LLFYLQRFQIICSSSIQPFILLDLCGNGFVFKNYPGGCTRDLAGGQTGDGGGLRGALKVRITVT
jgi:hypothetical protein